MTKCTGNKLSGGQCNRNASTGSRFCWQHKTIYDEKQLEIVEASNNRISKIPVVQMDTRIKTTENLKLSKYLEQNVLSLINSFTYVPENICKVFTSSGKCKIEFLSKLFKSAQIQKNPPNEIYLNKLFTFFSLNYINDKNIKKLLSSGIYYDEIYVSYAETLDIDQISDFMIYLFTNKFFNYFYLLYPIFKQRFLDLNIDTGKDYKDKDRSRFDFTHIPFDKKDIYLKHKKIIDLVYFDILGGQHQFDKYDVSNDKHMNIQIAKCELYFDKAYSYNSLYDSKNEIYLWLNVRTLQRKYKQQFYSRCISMLYGLLFDYNQKELEFTLKIFNVFKGCDNMEEDFGYLAKNLLSDIPRDYPTKLKAFLDLMDKQKDKKNHLWILEKMLKAFNKLNLDLCEKKESTTLSHTNFFLYDSQRQKESYKESIIFCYFVLKDYIDKSKIKIDLTEYDKTFGWNENK